MAPKKMKVNKVATQLQFERFSDLADNVIRVGGGCQAIPAEMDDYERSELFRVGLAMPITWVHDDAKTNIEAFKPKFESVKKISKFDKLHFEVVDSTVEETNRGWEDKGLLPIPESFGDSLTNAEHKSFVLGLYIFINNIYLVNEFMGNIGMGRVHSHYYGEFYHSEDYKIWKDWKKAVGWSKWKHDKSITIDWPTYANILTDSRHNELLSRLFANATDECKERLAEAGKSYAHKKISLRKFIFTLRDNVGLNMLVEAVAIGQEGHDLLRHLEPCYSFYIIQDLPSEHSSLTKKEIIDILKVRVSKSKSNELFWKSVWPRLVERGWRRGQTSKKMVFLVPGVIELSLRELFKGIHYFDSVCDVLNKVALEPQLIEFEGYQDISQITPTRLEPKISWLTGKSHATKPKALGDTSLDVGVDGISKIMELRSSPSFGPSSIANHVPDKPQDNLEIVIDMTLPQINPASDNGVTAAAAGANVVQQQPVLVPQRLSRRNRMLTTKAFEAFSNGYLGSKRKRKSKQEMEPARRVRGETDLVSSDGAVDGAISGATDMIQGQAQV